MHGGAGAARSETEGFEVRTVEDATRSADVVNVLLPDQLHKEVFDASNAVVACAWPTGWGAMCTWVRTVGVNVAGIGW